MPVGVDAGREQGVNDHDPPALTNPHDQGVGGDQRVWSGIQRPAPERGDLLVQLRRRHQTCDFESRVMPKLSTSFSLSWKLMQGTAAVSPRSARERARHCTGAKAHPWPRSGLTWAAHDHESTPSTIGVLAGQRLFVPLLLHRSTPLQSVGCRFEPGRGHGLFVLVRGSRPDNRC